MLVSLDHHASIVEADAPGEVMKTLQKEGRVGGSGILMRCLNADR